MGEEEVGETAELENRPAKEGATQDPTSVDDGQDEPAELEFDETTEQAETAGEPEGQVDVASISGLKDELEAVKSQADEYLDGWQRARAEFANYKKRTDREQQELRERVVGETISRYLGVVDDLERALRERPNDDDAAAWAEGIDLIYRKLITLLESEGVYRIVADGEEFDPNLHEALSHEESSDHQEGQVIEVIQPGYRMGERVLRPALVRVAK